MSTRAPETERAPAPPARIVEPSAAPGRRSRSIWIAVVVALLVGGLVGYLIGWNLGPTETQTVTQTVTETVAPPAYTTGDEVEAVVAFDGASCTYAGPAEVIAGTRATFAYTATVKGSSLIVWKVASGTTYEQVVQAVDTRTTDDPPPFMDYWEQSAPEDTLQQSLSMSLVEGTYVVSCATNPETSTNEAFTSTMIRVLPA
jgi:hypothetical protein